MTTRRLIEFGALVLIGDGMMGLLRPRWHSLLWNVGPQPIRDSLEYLAEHRSTARGIYALEVAAGVLLALQQTPDNI